MTDKHTYLTSFALIMFLLLVGYGCADDSVNPVNNNNGDDNDNGNTDPDTTETTYNYESEYHYNLNVIYFTPTDVEPLDDYEERLSGFLLYVQDYYKQWMGYWGFQDKTFGLLKDEEEGRIKITRIHAKHPVSAYPNNGGGYTVIDEVREYFEDPDREPDSEHYLVFMPQPETDPDGGLPYYGIGRWGFVVDVGQSGAKAENEGGGAAHELGHALNLPHNAHPKSRKSQIGTALMANGNNVWNNHGGSSETSLTEPSAEILNVNQVFSREPGNFYGSVDVELKVTKGEYKDGDIIISGKFQDDVQAEKAVVLLDPEGNSTYNQIGFTTPVIETDSFHVSIPTNELFETQNTDYLVRIWVIHRNGNRTHIPLEEFSFVDGIPDIDFYYGEVPTISKDGWSVIDFSDEEPSIHNSTGNTMEAKNIIDGDLESFWHSRFSDVDPDPDHPHYLTVDMGEPQDVDGFQFVQREGISDGAKRVWLHEFTLQMSNDADSWEDIGDFELEDHDQPQQIELDQTYNFRYFKIVTESSMYDGPRSSLAEVGVFVK